MNGDKLFDSCNFTDAGPRTSSEYFDEAAERKQNWSIAGGYNPLLLAKRRRIV